MIIAYKIRCEKQLLGSRIKQASKPIPTTKSPFLPQTSWPTPPKLASLAFSFMHTTLTKLSALIQGTMGFRCLVVNGVLGAKNWCGDLRGGLTMQERPYMTKLVLNLLLIKTKVELDQKWEFRFNKKW